MPPNARCMPCSLGTTQVCEVRGLYYSRLVLGTRLGRNSNVERECLAKGGLEKDIGALSVCRSIGPWVQLCSAHLLPVGSPKSHPLSSETQSSLAGVDLKWAMFWPLATLLHTVWRMLSYTTFSALARRPSPEPPVASRPSLHVHLQHEALAALALSRTTQHAARGQQAAPAR